MQLHEKNYKGNGGAPLYSQETEKLSNEMLSMKAQMHINPFKVY